MWPFVGLSPVCLCLSCSGEPSTGHSTPELASPRRAEGKDLLPRPAGSALPSAAQDTTGPLCSQGTLLAHVQRGAHHHPQVVFYHAAFQPRHPSTCWCRGLFLPRGRTLPFCLLTRMRFLSARSSSLSGSLWTAARPSGVPACPLSFLSSAGLLRVCSAPASRSPVVPGLPPSGRGKEGSRAAVARACVQHQYCRHSCGQMGLEGVDPHCEVDHPGTYSVLLCDTFTL